MEVMKLFDEKVAMTGISQGKLMMFIMKFFGEDYICNKALHFGPKDSFAIHSILTDEKLIYMADSFNNKIYKYDSYLNKIYETNVGRDPRHMCMDHENMYVANFESDNISIIDLNSFFLSGSIPAGIKAHDVVYSDKNKSIYTSSYEENQIMEYSIDTGKSRNFTTEGKPMHLFIQNNKIIVMTYFVNGSIHTKINFINLNDGKIEDIILIGGLASDFQLDYTNNLLYIINIVDKSLYVVNTLLRKIIGTIYVGGYPESIGFGDKNIYVTNSKKQEVTIIGKSGHNLEGSIDLQFVPDLIKVIH